MEKTKLTEQRSQISYTKTLLDFQRRDQRTIKEEKITGETRRANFNPWYSKKLKAFLFFPNKLNSIRENLKMISKTGYGKKEMQPNRDLIQTDLSDGEVRDAYNKISSIYYYLENYFIKDLHKKILEKLDPGKNDELLEIGYGTGLFLELLLKKHPNTEYTGIDISKKMTKKTKHRLKENNGDHSLFLADAEKLPFKRKQFEFVVVSETLELMPQQKIMATLKEINRVLETNGLAIFTSMTNKTKTLVSEAYLFFRKFFPKYLNCRPIPLKELVKNKFRISEHQIIRGFIPYEMVLATPRKN